MRGSRSAVVTLLAILGCAAWHVDPVAAESVRVGQAQNAIGTLVVVRPDGIEDRLQGKGALQLFEGDAVRVEASSQAMIQFRDAIQVALGENTTVRFLSRWEKARGTTPILRLTKGEIWVKAGQGARAVEVETPVAVAAAGESEFDLKVLEDGESVLTVIQGTVEFGTAFGTCPIRASTMSRGVRGHRCTKPAPTDVKPVVAWTQSLLQ